MLTTEIKRKIDYLRDVLVGKIPVPSQQIEQITLGLIYKFMSDIDEQNEELGGKSFFDGEYKKYAWKNIMDRSLAGHERVLLYAEGLEKMSRNNGIPQLFRDIFKGAFLPFKDPVVLDLFLKGINEFKYENSEDLGDAFEYLLSIMQSQGDAGMFRTPRHIIDFIVEVVDPQKEDKILDPACGTAGFLVSAYKHILKDNTDKKSNKQGSLLTSTERKKLTKNIVGYDISHEMVRLSLVNLYLHGFAEPNIYEYDTLSSLERWEDSFDCLLANPPFMTPRGGIKPHNRFPIQARRSEVLFVDYITEHLSPNGKAGIIVPEGIIFKNDGAYKQLRKMLVEDGLWAVVSLPRGVFNPYSGVQTNILFFNNTIARKTKEILFVKVENDGYDLGAQRRPIDKDDLPTRLETLRKYKRTVQENGSFRLSKEEEKFASVVKKEKISKTGDYNLDPDHYLAAVKYTNAKWPMVELGEVLDYEQPTKYIVKSVNYDDKYTTPVLTAGKTFVLGYTDEKEGVFKEKLPVIIFDDFTTARKFVDFPFKVKSSAMKILHARNDKVDIRFLYYVMQKIKFSVREHKRYWISAYSKIEIPLPALEVQREIIAELDKYQKVIDGAKQIINNYKPTIKFNNDWNGVELEKLSSSVTPPKKIPKNKYQTVGKYPIIDQSQKEIAGFTNDEKSLIEVGSGVVIFGDHTCSVKFSEVPFAQGADGIKILKTKENCLPKYLFYFLKANPIEISGYKRHFSRLKSISIPLPSIEIQKEIVETVEEEQKIIEANKRLIKIFSQKIMDRIFEVWGE